MNWFFFIELSPDFFETRKYGVFAVYCELDLMFIFAVCCLILTWFFYFKLLLLLTYLTVRNPVISWASWRETAQTLLRFYF